MKDWKTEPSLSRNILFSEKLQRETFWGTLLSESVALRDRDSSALCCLFVPRLIKRFKDTQNVGERLLYKRNNRLSSEWGHVTLLIIETCRRVVVRKGWYEIVGINLLAMLCFQFSVFSHPRSQDLSALPEWAGRWETLVTRLWFGVTFELSA